MEALSIQHGHATPTGTAGQPVEQSTRSVDSDSPLRESGIDLANLSESIGLSQKTVLELLSMFVVASWDDLSRIEVGIRSGNMRQVAEAAHSLKGAALSFELSDISSAARILEMGARGDALMGEAEAMEVIRLRLEAIARSIEAIGCQTI